ncbi:MAG: M50 family metallopeptidase [Candidatus Hadarchaeum sp.]
MSLLTLIKIELLFVVILLLPLLIQLVILFVISRALWVFTQRFFGRPLWLLLGLVGVPMHELSHAVAFWLTGAGVQRMVLFAPRGLPEHGGATGVVVPARKPSIVSQGIASIAPFFGCSLAAWLVLRLLLSDLTSGVQPASTLSLESLGGVELLQFLGGVLEGYWRGLVEAFTQLRWSSWQTYLALYLTASLGMGAAPSKEDLKLFLPTLLAGLVVLLPVFALIQAFGDAQSMLVTAQDILGGLLMSVGRVLGYATLFSLLALFILALLAPLTYLARRR